ncbi:MAG: hypothetical protein ABSG70_20120 [Terriglobales bacterium]
MAKTDYRKRMLIPHDGHPSVRLFTADGLLLACGYERVEFGGRGPYLEMTGDQLQQSNVHRIDDPRHVYFDEYRSNCKANVMVYLQKRPVDYAHYRTGFYYVSPFDLRDEDGKAVVGPLAGDSQPTMDFTAS